MTTNEIMTAFKGFNQDLTCRGFQFTEGGTVEHDGPVSPCSSGFHACTQPIDVLRYYPPASSVYHVVELEGAVEGRDGDSKVAARKLTVGASIGIPGLVKAQIEYVTSRAIPEKGGQATGDSGAASATGYSGAASATGDSGAASATGYSGAASATGTRGAASATGTRGAASATGTRGAASATGDSGTASATGTRGAASATGYSGAASATGTRGAASATGYGGAASATGKNSVAIVTGKDGRAAGGEDCWIVLTERDDDWNIVEVRAIAVGTKVDGIKIKPGVYYTLRGGKVVKA